MSNFIIISPAALEVKLTDRWVNSNYLKYMIELSTKCCKEHICFNIYIFI